MKFALIRFARVFISAGIGSLLSALTNDPKYFVIAPILSAVGKYAREKYHLDWLPF